MISPTIDRALRRRVRRLPRRLATLAVLASVVVAAAACGSTSSSKSTPASTKSTSSGSLASLLPPSIRSAGTITNGTPENNPPLIFLTGSQALTGIDYDLAQAMGKELGGKFTFQNIPFPGLIPALQSGRIDASLSILSDTPQRENTISFVDYIVDGVTLLGAYGNPQHISTLSDLCGKTVGATQGAIEAQFISNLSHEYCISKGKPAISAALYSSAADVLLALNSGRVVADIHPGAASQYIAKTASGGKKYQLLFPGKLYLANYGGIGIPKSATRLGAALVAALRKLQANGTYGRILAHYGLSRMALTSQQIAVNTATKVPLTAAQKKIYIGASPYITAK